MRVSLATMQFLMPSLLRKYIRTGPICMRCPPCTREALLRIYACAYQVSWQCRAQQRRSRSKPQTSEIQEA